VPYQQSPFDPMQFLGPNQSSKNMPLGMKGLLLKNQYLLDLHHKNDEQDTFEQWKRMLRNNEFTGLTNHKVIPTKQSSTPGLDK
jgi:hypothetical protein